MREREARRVGIVDFFDYRQEGLAEALGAREFGLDEIHAVFAALRQRRMVKAVIRLAGV